MDSSNGSITGSTDLVAYEAPYTALVARKAPGRPRKSKTAVKLRTTTTGEVVVVAKPTLARGIVRTFTRSGKERFRAQARHGEKSRYKVLDTLKQATDWQGDEETAMRKEFGGGAATGFVPATMLMPEVFEQFVALAPRKGGMHLTQRQIDTINQIARHPLIKGVKVKEMNEAVIRAYCESRRHDDGCVPSTVKTEFGRVAQVIRECSAWLGWGKYNPLDKEVRKALMAARLIAESTKRSRRPSKDELAALLGYFKAEESKMRDRRAYFETHGKTIGGRDNFIGNRSRIIPMHDMVAFAVRSTFRRGEITEKLFWSELKANGVSMWRKDPKSQVFDGPHRGQRLCNVPIGEKAMDIIKRQPRISGDDRVFPFEGKTVREKWARACKALHKAWLAEQKAAGATIPADVNKHPFMNLHFHDLRHEAISSMIHSMEHLELMQVTGHKTLDALLTYVDTEEKNTEVIAAKVNTVASKMDELV